MASETTPKKGGRPKTATPIVRDRRFYVGLSEEGLRMLHELSAPRGGFTTAKTAVIEEAIRRFHAVDTLIPKRKRAKEEPA